MIQELFKSLNDEQIKAVKSIDNHTLVLASPGSGKTAVLTKRIGYLLDKGVNPDRIVAFTFTNKAAKTMKWRLDHMVEGIDLSISTFHSFCFFYLMEEYLMKEKYISIIDEEEQLKIVLDIIEKYNLHKSDAEGVRIITHYKNGMGIYASTQFEQRENLILYEEYQKVLAHEDKIDFDDMNIKFLELLKLDNEFKERINDSLDYVLIDECQDLNKIQYEIIKEISKNANVFMVGDPDQGIYEWRGSDIRVIHEFIDDYNPDMIYLNKNYRSTKSIISHANQLIKFNTSRFDKQSTVIKKNDENVECYHFQNEIEESDKVAEIIKQNTDKKIFILYRNHNLSTPYERAFKKNNIKYDIKGKALFEYQDVKLILAYFKILLNSNDDEALERTLLYPKRGIGSVTLSKLMLDKAMNKSSLFEAFERSDDSAVKAYISELLELKEYMKIENPKSFYKRLLSYLKIDKIVGYNDNTAERIYYLNELFPETSMNPFKDIYDVISNIYTENTKDTSKSNVTLMTMHQSKGLEADIVFIVDALDGIIPSNKLETLKATESERKLFYVAMTRACEKLYVMSSSHRYLKGFNKAYSPSRFIEEAGL